MPFRTSSAALLATMLILASCNDHDLMPPALIGGPLFSHVAGHPDVRFSELHYDNTGTDTGEAIEISGPAGTDLTGWSVVLYNGANGLVYNTTALSGTIPATCDPRGVVVVNYAVNGIQNGAPDGLALVDNTGSVVEFLSYEGTFTATAGPAAGMTSTDIGVSETGSEPIDPVTSLKRDGSGAWSGPGANDFGVCNDDEEPTLPPPPPPLPETRVVEIHYDNTGTDAGEAIEVEGPAGTDLTGWSIVLYNGSGGAVYDTDALTGTIVERCSGRGVMVIDYPVNGIQNGSPDGVALVDPSNTVIEFLSYEGTFTADGGPADGMTSTDIGVAEGSGTPVGSSLWRNSAGVWQGPAPNTFGACNEGDVPPPPSAPIVINEFMADPLQAVGGASWGEWFEAHNTGAEPVDLQGWTIVSTGQPNHTIASNVIVPAGGFAVLGRGHDPALNGGITIDYNYFTGSNTIFLDATDALELRDAAGAQVDRITWTSAAMAKGVTRALRDASADNADANGANWGYSTTAFGDGDFGTPGAANGALSDTPPAVPNWISFSGRLGSDPPLPVGFEDQLFATLRDGAGDALPATFTWVMETPEIASIDQDGVIRALAAGALRVRATDMDGTTRTFTLPTRIATESETALYQGNAEFGEPADGDPSDDFLVRRAQYTASWNANRGTPNWVSYNLEETHFGGEDRCDCFTFDPELGAVSPGYTTAAYTGAGTFHGFGIDRGHLARSFDRTAGSLDNATTFYFTNIVPQAADLNQGPWAALEMFLGDQARLEDKEVYVVTGVAGSRGTVKREGRIVIPASTWKVAVILPRNRGLAHVTSHRDFELVAVLMPNDAGIRLVPWETYRTTVNAIEAASGYDLLALLPDDIEFAVESGIDAVEALVELLVLDGKLSSGNANSLEAKLQAAAQQLDRGNRTAGANQLQAFLREVDALEQSGRLGAADAAALREAMLRVIEVA